jgi:hypothetical protein
MHIGIYQPLERDAVTESKAAAMGGVTTSLNYIRSAQYYLNKGGGYKDFFPEVLALSEGNFFIDYGYHIAPISGKHIDEMQLLFDEYGQDLRNCHTRSLTLFKRGAWRKMLQVQVVRGVTGVVERHLEERIISI